MDAWCCGAGGAAKLGIKEYAIAVGKDRLEEAVASGAQMFVTACPLCIENFTDANGSGNFNIAIKDITVLLAELLSIEKKSNKTFLHPLWFFIERSLHGTG